MARRRFRRTTRGEELGARGRRIRRAGDGRQSTVVRGHRTTSVATVDIARFTGEVAGHSAVRRRRTRARQARVGAGAVGVMISVMVIVGHRPLVRGMLARRRDILRRHCCRCRCTAHHRTRDLPARDRAMTHEGMKNECDDSPAEMHGVRQSVRKLIDCACTSYRQARHTSLRLRDHCRESPSPRNA